MTVIYCLRDPRNNEVRYVGQTDDYFRRYREHCSGRPDGNQRKEAWVKELLKDGLKPVGDILEEVSVFNATQLEREHVRRFIEAGCDLLNEGTFPPSELTSKDEWKSILSRLRDVRREVEAIGKSLAAVASSGCREAVHLEKLAEEIDEVRFSVEDQLYRRYPSWPKGMFKWSDQAFDAVTKLRNFFKVAITQALENQATNGHPDTFRKLLKNLDEMEPEIAPWVDSLLPLPKVG